MRELHPDDNWYRLKTTTKKIRNVRELNSMAEDRVALSLVGPGSAATLVPFWGGPSDPTIPWSHSEIALQEQQALLTYESLLAQAIDPELRTHVETLCRDKLRHVELTERLLEIVD